MVSVKQDPFVGKWELVPCCKEGLIRSLLIVSLLRLLKILL